MLLNVRCIYQRYAHRRRHLRGFFQRIRPRLSIRFIRPVVSYIAGAKQLLVFRHFVPNPATTGQFCFSKRNRDKFTVASA